MCYNTSDPTRSVIDIDTTWTWKAASGNSTETSGNVVTYAGTAPSTKQSPTSLQLFQYTGCIWDKRQALVSAPSHSNAYRARTYVPDGNEPNLRSDNKHTHSLLPGPYLGSIRPPSRAWMRQTWCAPSDTERHETDADLRISTHDHDDIVVIVLRRDQFDNRWGRRGVANFNESKSIVRNGTPISVCEIYLSSVHSPHSYSS